MSKWSEFYERHRQRNFTPVFNAHLEAIINDTQAAVSERVWAWVMRRSWGNHADCCVNAQGVALTQVDCGRELGLDRRAVNPAFLEFQRRHYVSVKGRQVRPVDDPAFADSSLLVGNGATIGEYPAKGAFQAFFSEVWARQHQAEYEEYQQLERRRKEISLLALEDWKHFKRPSETGSTNGTESLQRNGRLVGNGDDGGAEAGPTKVAAILKSKQQNVNGQASSSFAAQVRGTLEEHGTIDDDVVSQLVAACRKNAFDCTAAEICHFIGAKAKLITKRTANPIGFLLAIVPKCFAGESFKHYRQRKRLEPESVRMTDDERMQFLEDWIAEYPDGNNTPSFREELEQLRAARLRAETKAKVGAA